MNNLLPPRKIIHFPLSIIHFFRTFADRIIKDMKNIALALSSGGARGLAHIGAIEELESQGYHITSIAGCSMGALIGGVYAAGKLEVSWSLCNMLT